ncbi:PH domain-containing protein, partial [Micromonospora echinofusca]
VAAVGLGWLVVLALVDRPVGREYPGRIAVPLVFFVLPVVASVVAWRLLWRGPVALVVADGCYRIPASPGFGYQVAGQALFASFWIGGAVSQLVDRIGAWPDDLPARLRLLDLGLGILDEMLTLLLGVVVALLVVVVLRGRPRVVLTPDALTVVEMFHTRIVPWEALAVGRPLRPSTPYQLVLIVARPELVTRRGLRWGGPGNVWVSVQNLAVHPWFLADVVRYHVDQPAARAGIGTEAGYQDLLRTLGVTRD